MRAVFLLLATVAAIAACGVQGANPQAKDRLDQIISAFNSKDEAKVKAMIQSSMAPAMFEKRKLEDWVAQTMQIAGDLAPLAVQKNLLDQPNAIVVEVKAGNGEKLGLRLDCESNPPHRIVGVRIDQNPETLLTERKKVDYSTYTSLKDLAKRIQETVKAPAMAIATWRDGKLDVGVDGIRKMGTTEPVTDEDRWLVGSIGKSMTSTLIATFIDEGKLNWTSKLGDLLKDIPMNAAYKDVTVEQVMQHLGGIPQDMGYTGPTVAKIVGALKDPTAIRASYVKDILNRDPIGKPGQKMAYSNAGYAILSHIAERVGKKPFEQLMKERVFDPIGMTSALCGMPGDDGMPSGKGQPHGHFSAKEGPRPGKMGGPLTHMAVGAGGGIACSIGDLAKYAAWHMNGFLGQTVPGLSSATIKRLHTPMRKDARGEAYAAGWSVGTEASPDAHGHNGSDGTFMAEMAFFPKEKLVVVGIVNVGFEGAQSPGVDAVMAVLKRVKG
ncbi:MAG: beta-lactamase family protein [Chlorobia bacterium]|nr:beta-lactamase family protein [Fimbriimonadaceae bacterium]